MRLRRRARSDPPRPLLPIERETLLAILGHANFQGRDELLAQIDHATVVGTWDCDCASVDLEVSRDAPRSACTSSPIPNQAWVLDADGEKIGGILIFLDDGYLSLLEIHDWLDPPGISSLPPVSQLSLWIYTGPFHGG